MLHASPFHDRSRLNVKARHVGGAVLLAIALFFAGVFVFAVVIVKTPALF